MQEQRLTLRLKSYWDLIRKENDNPDILHFNTGVVEDLWPNCLKVSVSGQGKYKIFQYDYMGEQLIKLYGKDLTGQMVDRGSSEFIGMVISSKLDTVAANRSLLLDDGHFFTRNSKMVKYRSVLLPFSNKKEVVTHVIVGVSYRVF